MTRADIANALRAVARHAHNPAVRHWKAVRKITTYLKETKDLGLVFRRGGEFKLSLFADVDYAERCNHRRSVSGAAVILGDTAVSNSSTTQHCVTLSTSEVEYVAMVYGAKSVFAIKRLCWTLFSHISVVVRITCMRITRGQKRWLKSPGFSTQQAH